MCTLVLKYTVIIQSTAPYRVLCVLMIATHLVYKSFSSCSCMVN